MIPSDDQQERAGGLLPPGLSQQAVLAWDGAAWTPRLHTTTEPGPDRLDLMTWNVLFDRYDEGQLHSEARRPLLVRAITQEANSGVDLIALQELQWPVLKRLLATKWLRDGWQVVLAGPPEEVDSCGLALLSRRPVQAGGFVRLRAHKGVLVARLHLGSGPVLVATTHLSSDHRGDASGRRAAELSTIRGIIDATALPVIVLGDLNDASATPPMQLGLRDLAVDHPDFAARPTFDSTSNPLAHENSPTKASLRLDRVLAPSSWRADDPRLVGTTPTDGLHPSDHYAVRMVASPRLFGP